MNHFHSYFSLFSKEVFYTRQFLPSDWLKRVFAFSQHSLVSFTKTRQRRRFRIRGSIRRINCRAPKRRAENALPPKAI
eukprot:UN02492